MLDSTRTRQPSDRTPATRPVLLRRISLGMLAGLLIQYGMGMIVNLYVNVPARDHGGGVLTAVGRALANGPASIPRLIRRSRTGRVAGVRSEGCRVRVESSMAVALLP